MLFAEKQKMLVKGNVVMWCGTKTSVVCIETKTELMMFAWVRVWADVCEKAGPSCIDESCLAWGPLNDLSYCRERSAKRPWPVST